MIFWSVLHDYLNSLARNDSIFYIKVMRWLTTQKTYLHCQKPKKNGLALQKYLNTGKCTETMKSLLQWVGHFLGRDVRSLVSSAAVFWDVTRCVTSQKTAAEETIRSLAEKLILICVPVNHSHNLSSWSLSVYTANGVFIVMAPL